MTETNVIDFPVQLEETSATGANWAVTATALERIDRAMADNEARMAELKSHALLLQAARQEVLHRDRALEAISEAHEMAQCTMALQAEAQAAGSLEICDFLAESLVELHDGILECAERVGA